MEILSYDPYHIGIKINQSLPMNILRQKILPKMRNSDFKVDVNDELPSNIKMENEVIGTDGENRIELNYPLTALNTVGTNPSKTTATFEKLLGVVNKLGYEMKGIASTIDVLTNVMVKTNEDPTKLINQSVKCDLGPWKEINKNTNVNGLKIDLIDEEFAKETLRILIGPSSLSPTTQVAFTIRYLNVEPKPVIDFGQKLEERIIKFAKSLGVQ